MRERILNATALSYEAYFFHMAKAGAETMTAIRAARGRDGWMKAGFLRGSGSDAILLVPPPGRNATRMAVVKV